MSTYNNNRFTPGNKGNLRLFMNKAFISQYYQNNNNNFYQEKICGCAQDKTTSVKQGWNDSAQTENMRISQSLTGTLGGKTTFGNFNKPVTLNYIGGWEGQPGGTPKPLRNTF